MSYILMNILDKEHISENEYRYDLYVYLLLGKIDGIIQPSNRVIPRGNLLHDSTSTGRSNYDKIEKSISSKIEWLNKIGLTTQ